MARKTTGSLSRLDNGHYQFRVMFQGKRRKTLLRNLDGTFCTTLKEAEASMERELRVYREEDAVERARLIQESLSTQEERLQRVQTEIKNRLATLETGWGLFNKCVHRTKGAKRTEGRGVYVAYEAYYRKFLDWMKANYPEVSLIVEVTEEHACEFLSAVGENWKAGTVNKYRQGLKMIYNTLIRDKKITLSSNPFAGTETVEDDEGGGRKEFTMEQLKLIFTEAENESKEMYLLLNIGMFLGCRLHDACNLRWEDIDLSTGIVTFIPNKIKHTVKNKASAVVKQGIHHRLMELLLETPAEQRKGFILPELQALHTRSASNITRRFQDLLERCGIETNKKTEKGRSSVVYGFHSLRYTFVSLHAAAGTPAAVIQKAVGHQSPAMTEHYTRISNEKAVEVGNSISLPQILDAEIVETPVLLSPAESLRAEIREKLALLDEEQLKAVLEFISK